MNDKQKRHSSSRNNNNRSSHGGGGQRNRNDRGSGGGDKRLNPRHNSGGGHRRHSGGIEEGDDYYNPQQIKRAATLRDKYLGLAKDAAGSGDRVEAEYYLQHADHYTRILNSVPQREPREPREPRDQQPREGNREGGNSRREHFSSNRPRHDYGNPDHRTENTSENRQKTPFDDAPHDEVGHQPSAIPLHLSIPRIALNEEEGSLREEKE